MVWLQERLRADCECPLYKANVFPDLTGKIINIKKNKMKRWEQGRARCPAPFGVGAEADVRFPWTVEEIGKGWSKHHTGKRNVYALSCE